MKVQNIYPSDSAGKVFQRKCSLKLSRELLTIAKFVILEILTFYTLFFFLSQDCKYLSVVVSEQVYRPGEMG